ncbi:hypothetical protein BB559_002844 [Furculomyces boomerangus]|uniref:Methyltransferase domain-containing protein n=1 Tax=Furculomyces boomerangus TaxID=61424 RepID=A0A2T9YRP7_9FUNG|nr:hypothetical protein BB559_002844 [Furculomyces boomerangus]
MKKSSGIRLLSYTRNLYNKHIHEEGNLHSGYKKANVVIPPPPEPYSRLNELPTETEADALIKESVESLDTFYKEYYEEYIERKKPVVRDIEPIKLGRKYIGMIVLPQFLIEAAMEYLKDKDKKLLRVDTLRIIDSLRSTEKLNLEKYKKNSKLRVKSENGLEENDDTSNVYINGKAAETPKNVVKDQVHSLLNNEVVLSPHNLEYGRRESSAYLASRFPSTFGVITNIFNEISKRIPDFKPKRILDYGCGPGTTLWSANEIWGGKVEYYYGVDVSENMLELAESIIESSGDNLKVKERRFERYLAPEREDKKYDVVVSSFTFSELYNDDLRKKTLESLWSQTRDVLVLVDRGTALGGKYISDARKWFMGRKKAKEDQEEFHFLAPCPHDKECPLETSTMWCHFSQRVQRPEMTMKSKHAKSNEEDLKYSYLVVRRGSRPLAVDGNESLEKESYIGITLLEYGTFLSKQDVL